MKHISILVPQKAILGSLEGTRQLFTQVNAFFNVPGGEPGDRANHYRRKRHLLQRRGFLVLESYFIPHRKIRRAGNGDSLRQSVCHRNRFERRFKKATANTVMEYIQRVKIEAAKMSLESSFENVNEVMDKVGYNDPRAFRNTFKKITGLTPAQYRNKYNREIVV